MLVILTLLDVANSSEARENLIALTFGRVDSQEVARLWRLGTVWTAAPSSALSFDDDLGINEVLDAMFAHYQHVDESSAKFDHRSAMAGDMFVVANTKARIIEHWLCAGNGWVHITELDRAVD